MEDERDFARMKMALRLFYEIFCSNAVRDVTTEAFPAAFSAECGSSTWRPQSTGGNPLRAHLLMDMPGPVRRAALKTLDCTGAIP